MTTQEIAKMFYLVKAAYPKTFENFGETETKNYIEAWTYVFADKDSDQVFKGLRWYLSNDVKGFPPSPGQIIACMNKLTPENTLNEMAAWRLVEKAVRNSLYNAEVEFVKLPQKIKRVIRDPGRLKEWAQMDIEEFNTVIQSNFIRSFRMEQQREQEGNNVPLQMRPMLDVMADELPAIEEKTETEKGSVPDADIANMIERLRKWDSKGGSDEII